MKGSEFDKLTTGQLVRIRRSGLAGTSHAADDLRVARVLSTDRWFVQPGKYMFLDDRLLFEFEGMKLSGRGSRSGDGKHIVVLIEKQLDWTVPSVPGVDQWTREPYLKLVSARDIIGVWTDEIEANELGARLARHNAARRAAFEKATIVHAQVTAAKEGVERIAPILASAGVEIPGWATTNATARTFSLNEVIAIVDAMNEDRS